MVLEHVMSHTLKLPIGQQILFFLVPVPISPRNAISYKLLTQTHGQSKRYMPPGSPETRGNEIGDTVCPQHTICNKWSQKQ